jgi:hypothetical protein
MALAKFRRRLAFTGFAVILSAASARRIPLFFLFSSARLYLLHRLQPLLSSQREPRPVRAQKKNVQRVRFRAHSTVACLAV